MHYYYYYYYYLPRRKACGILVPQSGIEPGPWALKARIPNYWTARELPICIIYLIPTRTLWVGYLIVTFNL